MTFAVLITCKYNLCKYHNFIRACQYSKLKCKPWIHYWIRQWHVFIEKYHYCEGDGTSFNILPSSIMYKTGYNQMTSNITVPQNDIMILSVWFVRIWNVLCIRKFWLWDVVNKTSVIDSNRKPWLLILLLLYIPWI